MTLQEQIDHATTFGQKLEDLVLNRGVVTLSGAGDRDKLLLDWSGANIKICVAGTLPLHSCRRCGIESGSRPNLQTSSRALR